MTAKAFLGTGAATAAAAVAGGVATDVDSDWYRHLDLPSWQPPGQVIGQVWTVLYSLTAGATARAWNRAGRAQRRRLATALAVNLGLNAAWPWVFFRWHRPVLGVAFIWPGSPWPPATNPACCPLTGNPAGAARALEQCGNPPNGLRRVLPKVQG